ncbi:hypothetical protein [Streptomyces sp. TLI_171]|uniref:hypothetical protein n=1 Tax=Streptomyces sp. TLI_171 TaxID=1938859 RepID=UPI000C17AD0F|nr:hypothetical protein [Streptomyces sp. TLI_171]
MAALPAAREPGPVARLRRVAQTPPGRLRTAGAVLVALALLFGVAAVWQSADRAAAARELVSRSEPLSQDAAEIYRSLADADATAAAGFLLAGNETPEIHRRYRDDLATASRLVAQAAARGGSASSAQSLLTELNQQIPRYTGLVETARAVNRQGLPLGGAYLRYASDLMQKTMLPNAQKLADAEARELDADYGTASATPWLTLLLGVLALAALGRYQLLLFRRTNRVFNPGLLAASLAVLAALAWLGGGTAVAGGSLHDARTHGIGPLRQLNEVRVEALQAHTAENLNLVSRGATEAYAARWDELAGKLAAKPGSDGSVAGLAPDAGAGAKAPLADAGRWFTEWQDRHRNAARQEAAGDYDAALALTLQPGNGDTADAAFSAADQKWAEAAKAEQSAFDSAAGGVDGVLITQAVAAALLAALAAAGTVRGIGRRLAEYR